MYKEKLIKKIKNSENEKIIDYLYEFMLEYEKTHSEFVEGNETDKPEKQEVYYIDLIHDASTKLIGLPTILEAIAEDPDRDTICCLLSIVRDRIEEVLTILEL